jgi:hypothetical protein
MWPHSERRNDAIASAVAGSIDWDHFLRIVSRHRVAGLVHDGLAHMRQAVPATVAQVISEQASQLVQQNLALAAEAVRLQGLFTSKDLPVAFLKGSSLAMLAYGDLGIRHGKDIDVLVDPDSIGRAEEILASAGYQRSEPPVSFREAELRTWLRRRKELTYIHEKRGLVVELHSRLFDNPRMMPLTRATGPLQTVAITNELGLPTLPDDDLFAYLCAHGAFHCWFRLKWLADICAIIMRQPNIDVERLYGAAHARGVTKPAAQALLLGHRLLDLPLTDQFATALRKELAVRWLEAIALRFITDEREPTESRFGTTWNNLSLFLLSHNWRYWMAELEHHFISPIDILMLPLPIPLSPLYPILRLPLGLWRKSQFRSSSR